MWSAAILAGGQARRFGGRDKSALKVDGRSIIERHMAEFSRVTTDMMIVGSDRILRAPGAVRLVPDCIQGCGPLGGLYAALAAAASDVAIVGACDMPYVSASLVNDLLPLKRDADVVVPRTDRGFHPLCAAYTRACLAPVARRLADGRQKITDLFEGVRVRVLTTPEIDAFGDHHRLLANLNTPAEHRCLVALHGYHLES